MLPDATLQRSHSPHKKSPTVVLRALVDMRERKKATKWALAGEKTFSPSLFAVENKKESCAASALQCSLPPLYPYLGLVKPSVLQELEERKPRGGLEEDEHFY